MPRIPRDWKLNRHAVRGRAFLNALKVCELLAAIKKAQTVLDKSLADLLTHEHLIVGPYVVSQDGKAYRLRDVCDEVQRQLISHNLGEIVLRKNELDLFQRFLRAEGFFRPTYPLLRSDLLELMATVRVNTDAAEDD